MMNFTIFYCKTAILPTILIEVFGILKPFFQKRFKPPEARVPRIPTDKSKFEIITPRCEQPKMKMRPSNEDLIFIFIIPLSAQLPQESEGCRKGVQN